MNSKTIWVIFVVLCIVHQDVWFWHDRTLVFGFIPVGLAYHAGISLAAVTLWTMAIRWAWPSEVEAWADELDGDTPGSIETAAQGSGASQ